MKKLLCLILTLALCINSIAIISADSIYNPLTNELKEFLSLIVSSFGKDYNISKTDLSELSYGSIIYAYTVLNGELSESQVKYIPIYYDNEVYGVIEKFPNGIGGYNYSYSEGYAEELNDFLAHNHSVVIVGAESGMIAYNEDDVAVLSGTFENSYINILESESEQLSYTTVSHSIPLDVESSMQQAEVNATNEVYTNYLNVPAKTQYNIYTCWAACVASVGCYKTNLYYTAQGVSDHTQVNNHGLASIVETQSALQAVFGLQSTIKNAPSILTIKNLINNDKPMISFFLVYDSNGNISGNGHVVVVRGYATSEYTFAISFMASILFIRRIWSVGCA